MARTIVLVVEDDADVREVIEVVLREEGHVVISAADGQEALGIVRHIVPGVILLDGAMPRMDGASFRAALAAEGKLAKVPIVSISGTTHPSDVHVLRKPFSVDALLGVVRSLARA